VIVERERISRQLAARAGQPVTLIAAPAGYGKSIALDDYLRSVRGDVLRFNVRRAHGSLTRFVRALAAALETSLPRMGQSLAIAHERATQSAKPSDVLATWLAEHLDGEPRTIVIDDFHHCEGERGVAELIANAVERTRPHVRWIVATRSSADLPVASWMARGDTDLPIDESTMRFTPAEARAVAACMAPAMDVATIDQLLDVTDGAPAIFTFGLQTIAQEPQIAERLIVSGGDPFGRFADEVFTRFSPTERKLLIETAAFPEIDERLLGSADEASPWLSAVAAAAPQIFEARDGRRQYHGLFLGALRGQLSELGSDAAREAAKRAALALERAGRIGEALAIYIRERRDADLVRVIEAHGFAFLEAGHGESIHEAINALDPLVQMTSSVVLAIKAMSESTTGRFDTAESWFQLALDRAADPLRRLIAYQYGTHLLRFFRNEAVAVFESIIADPLATDKLRTYVLAALGPAYVFERRVDEARDATREALALSKTLGSPHVLAKVHHQAAFVELYAGDARLAKDLASISLACATEHGFYDIAAGALSVLYGIASDIEDDPIESLRLLEAVGDCAAKSGSLINQLISLVAALEIEIERNNEDVAELIDEKLRTLDVSFAGRTTYEALLPTQALRASWAGDFVGAYRLLANSSDQQWSADRKALRFAEIAAYAAAAGLEQEALDALREAEESLAGVTEVDLRVQRARLYVTLAAIVLGRTEVAADTLAGIDASPEFLSRRLFALRRALGALFERYRGARNHNELLGYLDEMGECGFAGLARAITMLPLADNALRRVGRLSVSERAVAVRLADGEPCGNDNRLPIIMRKLGCAHTDALVRAVTWHRAAFEGSAATAGGGT
jgi:ATP/maltotriose-dependent transcriptional regulator MalT